MDCIGFVGLIFFVFVNNVLVWINYIGFDFEVIMGENSLIFGIDNVRYLRGCEFILGVNFNF